MTCTYAIYPNLSKINLVFPLENGTNPYSNLHDKNMTIWGPNEGVTEKVDKSSIRSSNLHVVFRDTKFLQ